MGPPQKLAIALQLLLLLSKVRAQDKPCSVDNPCTEGCCSSVSQVCGYGPDYCGSTCISGASTNRTCTQLAECNPGVYPGWGVTWGIYYLSQPATVLQLMSFANYSPNSFQLLDLSILPVECLLQ